MAWEQRKHRPALPGNLELVTAYRRSDTDVLRRTGLRGWYWWWYAKAPDGQELVACVQGPHPTEDEALLDAESRTSGVPVDQLRRVAQGA